jgi:penicillin-binding protein 2
MATLANNGAMFRTRLVSLVDSARTGERRTLEPQLVRQVPLKPEHVEFVKRAMAGVTKEGTGARAFAGAQYISGGKTGTAQVIAMKQNEKYDASKVTERLRDHSLYIAFAPLEGPKIALAVVVENGGFGARAAAPIARTVLDYFLLGKLPATAKRPAQVVEQETDAESD